MPKKVLIVDDDPDVRLFNSSVVQELGYLPIEAGDGEEGQQMVAREAPDLIILDVMMPLQSGIRLYRALKTDPAFADIPVIILSGISQRSFMKSQEALAAFVAMKEEERRRSIEKPADADTLETQIETFIRKA